MSRPTHRPLPPEELERYRRHLVLPEVGVEGQARLRASSVAIVGAGGLGSPLGLYLAAAGVGRLGLIDYDTVERTNLQRQVLYGTSDVGRPKIEVARERLSDLNPHVRIDAHEKRLDAGNAREILGNYDVVVDGSDNFGTRYLVNDACVLLGKPEVYGSIYRFEGQVSVFWAGHGPCYRCLFPEPPPAGAVPNCAEGGVLGVLPGVIGTLQANEVLKLLLGRGESLLGRLLLFDALACRFRELELALDAACPACGEDPRIGELEEVEESCAPLPTSEPVSEIDCRELVERMGGASPPLLVDVRSEQEWQICRLPGALLIPLDQLPGRLEEIDRSRPIVTYCHLGMRSLAAARHLVGAGYGSVRSLHGGIDAWADEIDRQMPRY